MADSTINPVTAQGITKGFMGATGLGSKPDPQTQMEAMRRRQNKMSSTPDNGYPETQPTQIVGGG